MGAFEVKTESHEETIRRMAHAQRSASKDAVRNLVQSLADEAVADAGGNINAAVQALATRASMRYSSAARMVGQGAQWHNVRTLLVQASIAGAAAQSVDGRLNRLGLPLGQRKAKS